MRYFLYFVAAFGILASCGTNDDQTDAELKDPAVVHPPSEAIPDSTKLVNDSVIVPDITPGTSDSTQ
jgi:hypothetical protein